MRAGVCSVPQALTTEAANVVKHAFGLARRRGHVQVTPLHVASAMLASSSSLFRASCRKTHSHPLQCKALELCFNVALNRLPTSTSSPLFGPHCPHPSLSNALVAAFKRAQAHQRRGSVENQQQPILALKIEIEQLVISILDDPSVSRVMREAGFSSPQVKANVEQAVSIEASSQAPPASSRSKESNGPMLVGTSACHSTNQTHFPAPLIKTCWNDEEVANVLDTLMSKRRRNTIVVGECLASTESLVKKVLDKLERGDVPWDLRFVQIISLPLSSLKNRSKDDVDQKLFELKGLVRNTLGRGVVLYLGDLKWVSEFWSNNKEQRNKYYCPVEHMIMGLRRVVCGSGEKGKIWLMGIANYKTYMSCKSGRPSLETIWELHPLAVPIGSLDLSLNLDSNVKNHSAESIGCPLLKSMDNRLTCCTDCVISFQREVKGFASTTNSKSSTHSSSTNLPLWLQQCTEDSKNLAKENQEGLQVGDLCKKWNSYCSTVHKPNNLPDEKPFTLFPSSSPSSSISVSSRDHRNIPSLHQAILGWPVIFETKQSPKEHQYWTSENGNRQRFQPTLRMYMPERNELKPDLLSNPNSSPNSASSSEAMEDIDHLHRFKDPSPENLKILCDALEKKVPWQKGIIPEIASTVLECRSGTSRKAHLRNREDKEETWLFFLGLESEGKEVIAKELARLIFGSQSNYVSISLSSFSSTKADSTDVIGSKRARDEMGRTYLERFAEAVSENPHRVFFVEDVEQADRCSQMGIKRAVQSGKLQLPDGDRVHLEDAIIIFSCESLSSVSRACSPPIRPNHVKEEKDDANDQMQESSSHASLDLNLAIEDDNGNEEQSADDVEILEAVDKKIIFKVQEL